MGGMPARRGEGGAAAPLLHCDDMRSKLTRGGAAAAAAAAARSARSSSVVCEALSGREESREAGMPRAAAALSLSQSCTLRLVFVLGGGLECGGCWRPLEFSL